MANNVTIAPETEANEPNPDFMYPDWTPPKAYHNVRALCDLAGLNPTQKNEICATIMGESEFNNTALNHNKRNKYTPQQIEEINNGKPVTGVIEQEVISTDWGICQINDRYHIGKGMDFPSVLYVLDNPAKAVKFMINMYLAGKIDLWCAHSNGSYQVWLNQVAIKQRLGIV